MRKAPLAAALGLILLLVPTTAARAEVNVAFVQPEHYTDAGNHRYDTDRNLRALEREILEAILADAEGDHT